MNHLDDARLVEIRKEVYSGSGYYVLRGFLDPGQVEHVYRFWRDHRHPSVWGRFRKEKHVYLGCPNVSERLRGVDRHYNFFWNEPLDSPTHATSWDMQTLRNRIEGNPPGWGFLPHSTTPGEHPSRRYVASYRVVYSSEGGAVRPHCDWWLDHSRLQLSLSLSSYGEDYENGGFVMYDRFRDGEPVNISRKENLRAGDLLVFRYAHKHGVDGIRSVPGGRGFCRILMPTELLDLRYRGRRMLLPARVAEALRAPALAARRALSPRRLPWRNRSYNPTLSSNRAQSEELYYDDDVARLMNIAIREGLDPNHVFNHRGLWGRFKAHQAWQLQVLAENGLERHHHFLDIGCAILRLGMPLIAFLDDDRYCGIDPVRQYIELAHVYMREAVSTPKKYRLICDHSFDFERFAREFDFAMAHSVFTHLSFAQIEECFHRLKRVMRHNGKLIFTAILGRDEERSIVSAHRVPMTKSSHRDSSFYDNLARRHGIAVEVLGSANHPTQQTLMAIF